MSHSKPLPRRTCARNLVLCSNVNGVSQEKLQLHVLELSNLCKYTKNTDSFSHEQKDYRLLRPNDKGGVYIANVT